MVEIVDLAKEQRKNIALQKELADRVVKVLNEPAESLDVTVSDLTATISSGKRGPIIAITTVQGEGKTASINLMQEKYYVKVLKAAIIYEELTGRKIVLRKDYGY